MARIERASSPSERAQMIDVLNEIGRRERIALVEDLVADAGGAGQPLAGKVPSAGAAGRPEAP